MWPFIALTTKTIVMIDPNEWSSLIILASNGALEPILLYNVIYDIPTRSLQSWGAYTTSYIAFWMLQNLSYNQNYYTRLGFSLYNMLYNQKHNITCYVTTEWIVSYITYYISCYRNWKFLLENNSLCILLWYILVKYTTFYILVILLQCRYIAFRNTYAISYIQCYIACHIVDWRSSCNISTNHDITK